jgi:hypothetical protein
MNIEKWGVGSNRNIKPFDTVKVGNDVYDLINGEYPHSRSDNTQYVRSNTGNIYAFDGHRRPIKIEVEEYNYLKTSHISGDEVRKGCSIKIYISDIQVYDGFARNVEYAYRRALNHLDNLELFLDWFPIKCKSKIGSIVIFKGDRCIIKSFVVSQSCIIIEKEDGTDFELWDGDHECDVKVEITSPHLDWYPDIKIN